MKIIISKCNMYKGVLKFNYFFCWELILLEVGEWGNWEDMELTKVDDEIYEEDKKEETYCPSS